MKPELRFHVRLESSLSPSEDPKKVIAAMNNIVGECVYDLGEERWSVRITSDDPRCLVKVHDQLRDRRVRAAARRLLTTGREGRRTTVMLNRQAAAAGVIVLCSSEAESPLGPIYLTIESEQLDAVIDWLTAYEAVTART